MRSAWERATASLGVGSKVCISVSGPTSMYKSTVSPAMYLTQSPMMVLVTTTLGGVFLGSADKEKLENRMKTNRVKGFRRFLSKKACGGEWIAIINLIESVMIIIVMEKSR